MSETPDSNTAQIEYWNATAGPVWVEFQDQLDRQIEPLGRKAMLALAPAPGERVVDIGCGCGQSTVELAARVGRSGAVLGIDISEPMLAVARGRRVPDGSARPSFRQADAQADDLGQGAFDAAFSRFGVMFFADPVAAFANIRAALKSSARLGFVCWRPLVENPWMLEPMQAALPLLPPLPPPDPTAPGPFAFADAERVRAILTGAGFSAIRIEPFDTPIGGSSVEQTLNLAFRVGPLGAALREHPERAGEVAEAVRAKLVQYDAPGGVFMPAAVWIVQARNG